MNLKSKNFIIHKLCTTKVRLKCSNLFVENLMKILDINNLPLNSIINKTNYSLELLQR